VVGLASIVGLVLVLGACKPLREYPAARTMLLGTAAQAGLLADPEYSSTLAREFNGLTPEFELKWSTIHPGPTTYNFGPADTLVDFARDHDIAVRGVPLLWHESNPAWLTSTTYTREQTRQIMLDHIRTVVSHYRGQIVQWDVVNEPFNADGTKRRTLFRRIGARYMDEAFAAARAADPGAKLFLNEIDIELGGPKADGVFTEVSRMRARGVPIDGVGFQMHSDLLRHNPQQLAAQMARYAAIGVEVAVTEMDVRLPLPASAQTIQQQATVYREVFATCRAAPNCKTFVMWGFTDRFSWIPLFFPGYGAATVLDPSYGKKPAYDALNQHLANS
jgi:endo-1,4-beta-xylanase